MKRTFITVFALIFSISFCMAQNLRGELERQQQGGSLASPALKTELDLVAYAFGVHLGDYARNADSTFNMNIVVAAMMDVVNRKSKYSVQKAQQILNEYFAVSKPKAEKQAAEEFLTKVEKENKRTFKTASGLLYEILREGTGKRAENDTDKVRVMYRGTLKNGQVFDSSYERGETAEFALNSVIKGWGEGLKLVGEGGRIRLWIPPELGYGEYGPTNIGPNQALIFDVELIEVIRGK